MTAHYTYDPSRFDVESMVHAQEIILTDEANLDTAYRWETEGPYLDREFFSKFNLNEHSKVLDYGCGIGRLSKLLIQKYGCWVIGADISPSMRALSMNYVNSDRFAVTHPNFLMHTDLQCDLALSIWVLQHCLYPKEDIENIKRNMKDDGQLFVVNNIRRVVPITTHFDGKPNWGDDKINMKELLAEHFTVETINKLDPAVVTEDAARRTFVGTYRYDSKIQESKNGRGD